MKVILKQEVDNLGLAGDVVDVADGYGRNFLLPRGLAIKATRGAAKEAQALTRARKAREARTLDDAKDQAAALEARTYRIEARCDDGGHLYGSVRADDVHRVIKERGHDIEKRRIDLRSPIKLLGTYEIEVRVHPQVHATVVVEVVDVEGVVRVDEGGRIVGPGTEEAPPISIEEQALEAAAELESAGEEEPEEVEVAAGYASEGPTEVDPAKIMPDQPARPEDVAADVTEDEGT